MLGWECPKCGRCYAPSMLMCTSCGQQHTFGWTGTVTIPVDPAPCTHEVDDSSTVPRCKKCGYLVPVVPGITISSVS